VVPAVVMNSNNFTDLLHSMKYRHTVKLAFWMCSLFKVINLHLIIYIIEAYNCICMFCTGRSDQTCWKAVRWASAEESCKSWVTKSHSEIEGEKFVSFGKSI